MTANPELLTKKIQSELSRLSDKRLIDQINNCLIHPELTLRHWDYGVEGEQHPCWSIFSHRNSGTEIIYSEYGHGPQFPWGLSTLTDDVKWMGPDSNWFESFLYAYLDGFAPTYLDIWRVFKTQSRKEVPIAITAEAGWNDTWVQVMEMRKLEPNLKFDCRCDASVTLRGY